MSRTVRALAVLFLAGLAGGAAAEDLPFPRGFLWGTATSGFQTEMGGAPVHQDRDSDWWVWTHDPANIAAGIVNGVPEDGPAFYERYPAHLLVARQKLGSNAFRLSIEWSRIFPRSTAAVDIRGGITLEALQQLDALADQREVAHYRAVLSVLRLLRLKPFVTLTHFSLPLWLHDPIAARDALAGTAVDDPNLPPIPGPAGWLDPAIILDLAKFAAYLGWKFGHLVDFWLPLNEPVVNAINGYLNIFGYQNENFPPGAHTLTGTLTAIFNQMRAHAAAYKALRRWDRGDADRDGKAAVIGVAKNLPAFQPMRPGEPADEEASARADYLFNRLFLNGIIHGDVDLNIDGIIGPDEHFDFLADKLDFIGVNYYERVRVRGAPGSPLGFEVFFSYPPGQCPSICTETGSEIYPAGLAQVLEEIAPYRRPIYITENGLADADDDQRPAFLVQHLQVLQRAIRRGADVRGYLHWSLMDNLELTRGYGPKFGLCAVAPRGHYLLPRPSAGYFRRIARANALPADLVDRFGLPLDGTSEVLAPVRPNE